MKKIAILMVVLFLGTTAFAQESSKNTYKLKDGLIEATLYHDNGQIAQTGFYTEEGKLHGKWMSYNAQGERTAVAQYKEGKRVGTWLFYQGDTLKEVTYTNNALTAVSTYTITDTRIVSGNK